MSIIDIYCHNCFSSSWVNHPNTQCYYHLYIGQMGGEQLYSCYSPYSSVFPFLRITYLPVSSSTYHPVELGTSLDITMQSKIYLDP